MNVAQDVVPDYAFNCAFASVAAAHAQFPHGSLPACLSRLSACPQLFAFLILPAYHHYHGTPSSSSSIFEFDNPAATQHSTGVRQLVHTILPSQEGQRVPTYASTRLFPRVVSTHTDDRVDAYVSSLRGTVPTYASTRSSPMLGVVLRNGAVALVGAVGLC